MPETTQYTDGTSISVSRGKDGQITTIAAWEIKTNTRLFEINFNVLPNSLSNPSLWRAFFRVVTRVLHEAVDPT